MASLIAPVPLGHQAAQTKPSARAMFAMSLKDVVRGAHVLSEAVLFFVSSCSVLCSAVAHNLARSQAERVRGNSECVPFDLQLSVAAGCRKCVVDASCCYE